MFDHARMLGLFADHEPGGVVQPNQRHTGLVAGLYEMRDFVAACRVQRPVVADDAHTVSANRRMHTQAGGPEIGFESQKL